MIKSQKAIKMSRTIDTSAKKFFSLVQESESRARAESQQVKENTRFHELWQRLPTHHVNPVRYGDDSICTLLQEGQQVKDEL
jgi:hypothetical protein